MKKQLFVILKCDMCGYKVAVPGHQDDVKKINDGSWSIACCPMSSRHEAATQFHECPGNNGKKVFGEMRRIGYEIVNM